MKQCILGFMELNNWQFKILSVRHSQKILYRFLTEKMFIKFKLIVYLGHVAY